MTIHVTGEAYGVKTEGGILETASHRLRIRCLPKDLPDFIEVNVAELKVGETIHVSELKPLAGVEFLDDKTQAVVICVEPPAEEVVAVVAPVEGAVAADGTAAVPATGDAAAAPAAGAKPGDTKTAAAAAKGDAKAAAPAAGAKPAAAPAKK